MRIGVAKEIKPDEYRVALTPAGALELDPRGHQVTSSPAPGSAAPSPTRPTTCRARIAPVEEVWASSDLLLKVKEPIADEYGRLRDGLTLFTYLHIAADAPLTRALVDSGVTAVAYETVETARGALPLLAPMSEVAGRLASQAGAYFLRSRSAGAGSCSAASPVSRRDGSSSSAAASSATTPPSSRSGSARR